MNNNNLILSEKWLDELGIRTHACPTCLMVNRDDVVNLVGDGKEFDLLNEMKSTISTKLFWGSRDDTWFYLESF